MMTLLFSREVGLVTSTNQAFTGLLDLLGWRYAVDGSKSCEFAPCFDALGITIDLSDSRIGLARFANAKKRCAELSECLKGPVSCERFVRDRGSCLTSLVGSTCAVSIQPSRHALETQCFFSRNQRRSPPRCICKGSGTCPGMCQSESRIKGGRRPRINCQSLHQQYRVQHRLFGNFTLVCTCVAA